MFPTGSRASTGKAARAFLAAAVLLAPLPLLGAAKEQGVQAVLPPAGRFSYIERADLRRYVNGSYAGLEYREVRGTLQRGVAPDVTGTFYVLQGLDHDGARSAQQVDQVVPASWSIQPDGTWTVAEGAYPTLRGFPVLPLSAMAPGDQWTGVGTRLVDPLHDGTFTRTRFLAGYRYEGDRVVSGRNVRVLSATWASRYKPADDPAGDPRLVSLAGTHSVSLQLALPEGTLSFIQDQVDETYRFADGTSVQLKGFILTWFTATAPLDRAGTASLIAQELADNGVSGVTVDQENEGVRVSLSGIHFVADQAVFLPEETARLDALASALKQVPGRSFLVVGHTADVGTSESQRSLSVDRAKAVVDFLTSHGMSAERFLYEGRGGTEPVAPNDTEENRAKNRRVEIFVLED